MKSLRWQPLLCAVAWLSYLGVRHLLGHDPEAVAADALAFAGWWIACIALDLALRWAIVKVRRRRRAALHRKVVEWAERQR